MKKGPWKAKLSHAEGFMKEADRLEALASMRRAQAAVHFEAGLKGWDGDGLSADGREMLAEGRRCMEDANRSAGAKAMEFVLGRAAGWFRDVAREVLGDGVERVKG